MQFVIFCLIRILCTFHISNKILTKEVYPKFRKTSYILCILVLFVISLLIQDIFPSLRTLIFVSLTSICLLNLYKLKATLAISLSVISYSIYYVVFITCAMFPALICSFYYYHYNTFPYTFFVFVTGTLTIFSLFLLPKTKRTNYGFSLFRNRKILNTFTILCLVILLLKSFYYSHTGNNPFKSGAAQTLVLPFSTILLALLLFTWWQKQITKSYIEKLRKLEVQSLYDELEEKERQIQKLAADNESLSRIIHKDNKLIPAMENAVVNFLSTEDFHNPDKLKQYGLELTQKLQDMARNRQDILNSYDRERHNLRLTGHVSLDAILVYMQKKADANHISFECKHTPETIDYLLTKISEDDLTHLLSDLMENAIISMREQGNGRLQITFGKLQKEAYISIADSGIQFDIATLHSFGLQPHTTHKDSGGSGIGLMDIWKIKRKYRATIQIQEYVEHTTNFTKRILFSFNAKNHYVIQSFRHAEISNKQTRGDLYIIPAEAKEKNGGKKHERNTENLNS